MRRRRPEHLRLGQRPGQSLAIVAVMMIGMLSTAALAIDVGMVLQVRNRVQAITDATALAAAQELPSQANARTVAAQYALQNAPDQPALVDPAEVVVGNWDGLGMFTPGGSPVNAVRVVGRRTAARGNSVSTFFAKMFSRHWVDIATFSTATSGGGGGVSTLSRFIIDEEIFKDPAKLFLENLAKSMNQSFDWIIRDNDGDWFIDIPPGTEVWVPTGQTGDEALFDIGHPTFPFTDGTNGNPTFEDFLNYNEDSNSWRYNLINKNDLDPLLGVDRVSHAHLYPGIIQPLLGKCQVSPMYKSDISALNPVSGVPAVNALGWRNGLMAFSIEELGGPPPGGSSSDLPMLRIKIWDPASCNISWPTPGHVALQFAANTRIRLVQ